MRFSGEDWIILTLRVTLAGKRWRLPLALWPLSGGGLPSGAASWYVVRSAPASVQRRGTDRRDGLACFTLARGAP